MKDDMSFPSSRMERMSICLCLIRVQCLCLKGAKLLGAAIGIAYAYVLSSLINSVARNPSLVRPAEIKSLG